MSDITAMLNTINEGDALKCLQQLPDDCIDITVTSPPYNKKRKTTGWLVRNNGYSHFDDHLEEDAYQEWQIKVLNEVFRVTKPGGALFYNHQIRWFDGAMIHPYSWVARSGWTIRQEIIWDRGIAANMRGWRFWPVDERIYWLYKPKGKRLVGDELKSRHAKMSSIWRLPPAPRTDHHPAPFPLELPIRAIYSLADKENMVILDPFCGAGTTLVAARILGHSFLGFDISPTYVDYARQRVGDHLLEAAQAEKEMSRHFIEDSFTDRKKRGRESWPFGPRKDNGPPSLLAELEDDGEVK